MKKTLLAAALAAATMTAQADVKLSGHVNYVLGDLEEFNGNEDLEVGVASTSESRFRIVASKEANGITYGLKQEFGLGGPGTQDKSLNKRVNEFWLKGSFGKVSLGQGSEAGDGSTENDYSGTYVLNGAAYNSWQFPSLAFDLDDDTVTDFTIGFSQIDGGRDERLRYDSPKLGGIATVSLDIDTNGNTGLAINASGSNWKAGLFTESKDGEEGQVTDLVAGTETGDAGKDGSDEIGGSIAGKFGGFTAAFQFGQRDEKVEDGYDLDYQKIIIGYRSGPYSFAIDFGTNDQSSGADDAADLEVETTGLSFVYRPTGGVELYAGWRDAEVTIGKTDANPSASADADGILLGGRVRF
ncbi:MAG: porin [Cellvibrionaceae bacterium]